MGTLEGRLKALEQAHRNALPPLVVIFSDEQEGEPTHEQREQIAMAERQGRELRIIRIVRAEDLSPAEIAIVNCRAV
jgi:hypothetical protein